jgi:hypothetical protein
VNTHSKVELALIPVAVAGVAAGAPWLPTHVGVGELLTAACLAWLLQGGLRDAWLLYRMKTRPARTAPRKLACMCLESSAGFAGVVVGAALAATERGGEVSLDRLRWTALAAVVLATGFALREVVITWRPFGLRREPDHHTIVFTWW